MISRLRGRSLQVRRARFFAEHPLCAGPDSLCERSGKVREATELDHIVPLFKGGDDGDPANWQSLCSTCHKAKSARERGCVPPPSIGVDGYPIKTGGGR